MLSTVLCDHHEPILKTRLQLATSSPSSSTLVHTTRRQEPEGQCGVAWYSVVCEGSVVWCARQCGVM